MNQEILNLVKSRFPQIHEVELQEEIASKGSLMEFKAGETIMDYGSYIRLVPLLIDGSLKVMREDEELGREILLYYLNAGETCSMSFSCCLMSKQSEVKTVAEEDSMIIGIPVQYVDQWISKYKSWKNFVMTSYDERMKEMVKTINSIAFQKMDQRLIEYLEKKSIALNSKSLTTTHQEIADDLNASREAISRLLKRLETDGIVHLGRHKIELVV